MVSRPCVLLFDFGCVRRPIKVTSLAKTLNSTSTSRPRLRLLRRDIPRKRILNNPVTRALHL
jgi:hypothetical protein